jgi:hypothetical protein
MALHDVKLIAARRRQPLSANLIKIRYANPQWYAAAVQLYARRRADQQQKGSK